MTSFSTFHAACRVNQKTIRGVLGLLGFLATGALFMGQLGCEPPAVALPEGPEAPEAPSESNGFLGKAGNCCVRSGKMMESKCDGKACCVPDLDEDGCEKVKGYWFFTPAGCAGAC